MISYGKTVRWTSARGSEAVSVNDCATREEAIERAFKAAFDWGYTPPKWWQFWRWGDTPLPKDFAPPTA